MAKINTAPLGGTRDYLAVDVWRRGYIVETVHRVYRSYGFEPLETPTMERLTTLLGKYGEEGDQLLYRVLKRGASLAAAIETAPGENSLADEGLRYDLTVPLARVVAEYRQDLPPVYKRYQIQPVFRADRPARGRYREFWQCDLDIAGTASMLADAEVIGAAALVLQELGFSEPEAFSIRLNHRGVLRGLMEVAGVPPALEGVTLVAVDKLNKIGIEGVRTELAERGIEQGASASLLGSMDACPTENHDILEWLSGLLSTSEIGTAAVADLRALSSYAVAGPAHPHLQIDPYLARGLSYYTGPIFEIAFAGENNSGGGGGRYDELLGMFAGRQIPACGFSLGLERILLIMEERAMFPDEAAFIPQVLVTQFGEEQVSESLSLARELRAAGLRVDVYPEFKGYGTQFKYADKRGIRYALLLSPREIDAGVVALKDLTGGEQQDIARDAVVDVLRARFT